MFTSTGASRWLRYALALSALALVASAALGVGQASAHASFVKGTPGPGDTVCAPSQVSDYFAQHIEVLTGQDTFDLWVTDSNDNQVDNNDNAIDPMDSTHMTVSLPQGLANGVYTVSWYTVSADDGHEDSGSYTFTISC